MFACAKSFTDIELVLCTVIINGVIHTNIYIQILFIGATNCMKFTDTFKNIVHWHIHYYFFHLYLFIGY